MNTEYTKANLKDNVAAAAVLAATFIAIVGSMINSTDARANHETVQQMDTIVVTAPRIEVARMDTIVVTASREANILLAAN
jgi:hypothetical protein